MSAESRCEISFLPLMLQYNTSFPFFFFCINERGGGGI